MRVPKNNISLLDRAYRTLGLSDCQSVGALSNWALVYRAVTGAVSRLTPCCSFYYIQKC